MFPKNAHSSACRIQNWTTVNAVEGFNFMMDYMLEDEGYNSNGELGLMQNAYFKEEESNNDKE